MPKVLVVVLLAVTAFVSCEPDTAIYVPLEAKMPPTFSFAGPCSRSTDPGNTYPGVAQPSAECVE